MFRLVRYPSLLLACALVVACRPDPGITPIDFDDDRLRDRLAPLGRSIGNSRIVLLGENGHGVGEFTEAKVKLVEWLHDEHGFDVIAFESGFFECGHVGKRIAELRPADALFQCLRYPLQHAELLPLFETIREHHGTARPLQLAGIDIQPQGYDSRGRPAVIREILEPIDPALAERVVAADVALFQMEEFGGQGDDLDAWVLEHGEEARGLYRAAAARTDGWAAEVFRMAIGWIDRLLVRARVPAGGERPARYYELRDEWMAHAVGALADGIAGERKVVVWLHNDHARYGKLGTGSATHRSAGGYLRDRYGDAVYAVGFFMGSGTIADNRRRPREMAPPDPGGIESYLRSPGAAASYLGLRGSSDPVIREWASSPVPYLRMGTRPLTLVPAEEFDALVYIDTVAPPDYDVNRAAS